MTKDEALRLALAALERYVNEDEVIEGMRGNEPWVETKRMGEKAITAIKATLEANEFNPDWDTQTVLTEEIQCMAKRIEELEAKAEEIQNDKK